MMMEKKLEWSEVPYGYAVCFNGECARREQCLRYQVGLLLQSKKSPTTGMAVFPNAYGGGQCSYYKEKRMVRVAWGFAPLFRNVKHVDYTNLRTQIKLYLGSHSTYYRYNRGDQKLYPAQQEWILNLFARHGYTEGMEFEHYEWQVDFAE